MFSKNIQIPKYTKFHKGKKYMVTQQLHNCLSKSVHSFKTAKVSHILLGLIMSDLFINQQLHSYITVSVKTSKYTKFHKEKEYKVTQLDVAFAVVCPIIVCLCFISCTSSAFSFFHS